MMNGKKIISFEHDERDSELTYYVTRSPDIRFGQNKDDAIIFSDHASLMTALDSFECITYPWPKMVIIDA